MVTVCPSYRHGSIAIDLTRRAGDRLRLRRRADADDQLFTGFWPLVRVATVVEAAGARVACLETSDVKEEAARVDDAVWRVDTIVEEHAHFVFVGTEKHPRAFGASSPRTSTFCR